MRLVLLDPSTLDESVNEDVWLVVPPDCVRDILIAEPADVTTWGVLGSEQPEAFENANSSICGSVKATA